MKIKDFEPSLRNLSGNRWEASIRLLVVGDVSVIGDGWQDAKLKLWLVAQAVEQLNSISKCQNLADWNDGEWKSAIQTMKDLSQTK